MRVRFLATAMWVLSSCSIARTAVADDATPLTPSKTSSAAPVGGSPAEAPPDARPPRILPWSTLPPWPGAGMEPASTARVTLDTDDVDETLYLIDNGKLGRLCTGTCRVDLPAGFHRFAVRGPDGMLLTGDRKVEIRDGSRIGAKRETLGGLRALGIVVLVVGPIVGIAMVLDGALEGLFQGLVVTEGGHPVDRSPGELEAGGAVITLASVGLGVAMVVASRDRVRFELQSGTALAPLPRDAVCLRAPAKERPSYAPGLTATLRF